MDFFSLRCFRILCCEIYKLNVIECFFKLLQVEIFIFPLCIYLWSPVPKKGRICQVTLCNSYITVSLYLILCV